MNTKTFNGMKRYVTPTVKKVIISNESIMQTSGTIDGAAPGGGNHGVNAGKGSGWDDDFERDDL